MRDDFLVGVKRTLARRVNYHCSNPLCRKLTVGPNQDDNKSTLIGVAAHITAASTGGPRYDRSLSQEERKSIQNAIWLCHNCSDLVDKDEGKFSPIKLLEWKKATEAFIQDQLIARNSKNQDVFESLIDVLNHLMSSKRISEIIPKLFELSILNSFNDLNELCTREMNGWYIAELPDLNERHVPEYRLKSVLISPKALKYKVFRNISARDFLEEYSKNENVFEIPYLFHEPLREIEEYRDQFLNSEEKALSQEVSKGVLKFGSNTINHDTNIWYLSSVYGVIESGLRKELSRILTDKIKEYRT